MLSDIYMQNGREEKVGHSAYLLQDLVDVDLEGFDLALALLSLASSDLLGHLLGGLLLGLGCHGCLLSVVEWCSVEDVSTVDSWCKL